MIDTTRLNDSTVQVITTCCRRLQNIKLTAEQESRWRNGELIQNVVNMSPDERELLISGTCATCWDKMFGDDD